MNIQETLVRIYSAFKGVPRPETSLRQFVLTDKFGMSGDVSDEEWDEAGRNRIDDRWEDIPGMELEECGCQLAHMMSDDVLYYLPAYMRHSLNHIHIPLWKNTIAGSVIFHLSTPNPMHFSNINRDQAAAICAYLEYMKENLEGKDGRLDAEYALSAWLRIWDLGDK